MVDSYTPRTLAIQWADNTIYTAGNRGLCTTTPQQLTSTEPTTLAGPMNDESELDVVAPLTVVGVVGLTPLHVALPSRLARRQFFSPAIRIPVLLFCSRCESVRFCLRLRAGRGRGSPGAKRFKDLRLRGLCTLCPTPCSLSDAFTLLLLLLLPRAVLPALLAASSSRELKPLVHTSPKSSQSCLVWQWLHHHEQSVFCSLGLGSSYKLTHSLGHVGLGLSR